MGARPGGPFCGPRPPDYSAQAAWRKISIRPWHLTRSRPRRPTEAEAAAHGGRVAFLPRTEVDRAVAAGKTRGFVKLIAGPRRVLGNAA